VLDHRAIEAGSVTIVVAVHLGGVEAVIELHEMAAIAPDETQGTTTDLLRHRSRKDARELLFAEIDDPEKAAAAAPTARLESGTR
jgi:hypothetical protein